MKLYYPRLTEVCKGEYQLDLVILDAGTFHVYTDSENLMSKRKDKEYKK